MKIDGQNLKNGGISFGGWRKISYFKHLQKNVLHEVKAKLKCTFPG